MEFDPELRTLKSAYSPSQIAQWEKYVKLPSKYRSASKPALNVDYLTALHIHQICKVPYENLVLHYSQSHAVSLDTQVLFQKMVGDNRGRGGYCMENNIFFNHVLRALGFTVYTAGVKIRPRKDGVPGGNYTGWVHIINIVTLPTGDKYVLDVGFGGDGPTHPLPLIHAHESKNIGTQVLRLIHVPNPANVDQTQKWWIYQYHNTPTQEWNSLYSFPGTEFSESDFAAMNWWTSTSMHESNFQTRCVLMVRFLMGEDGGVEGKVMLVDGVIKRNDGGKTKTVLNCKSEEERLKALLEYFDLRLTEEEVSGIRGRPVELKASRRLLD